MFVLLFCCLFFSINCHPSRWSFHWQAHAWITFNLIVAWTPLARFALFPVAYYYYYYYYYYYDDDGDDDDDDDDDDDYYFGIGYNHVQYWLSSFI